MIAAQLEILDLRHFSAHQLRPLLEREARMWKARLRWDYDSSVELLLKYLDSRILPGFVALDRGRVSGFTFCVYEGHKAVVGDAFSIGQDAGQSLQFTNRLLSHLLELLTHSPDIERIESQMLLYDVGEIEQSFVAAGFALYPRLFMEYDLTAPIGLVMESSINDVIMDGVEVVGWAAAHYQAAAELIHASYANHIDASINDQYRSLHGSLRFLHNIVRFPGCGVFEAGASWVLRDRVSGALVGMVLCSRVAGDVAHITQICIAEEHRGRGLGRALLRHCVGHLAQAGFSAITLTVTEQNQPAVSLYEELGFCTRHRFHAMVLDKKRG